LCFGRRYPKQNSVNSFPPTKTFLVPPIFGLATLLVLLKDCWEPHKRCLGAACHFQKNSSNLLPVQHLKWLRRRVSNVDCCGQFGWWRNRCLTHQTCRTIFRRCYKFLLSERSTHECIFWVRVRSYQSQLVVNGRQFWHELNIFAMNLIALKLFCILCYFLQQKVCSIVFSNYCSPNYWDFCAAYTELYLLLHHIQSQRCKSQL